MRVPRLAVLAAVAGVAAAILTGCGSDKAEGDNTITVYSGRTESLIKPVIEEFTKATGIKVEVRYGETAATAAQIVEEGDKTKADVFLAQDAGALGAVAKKGLLATLPTALTDKVPAEYRAKDGAWVGVTGRARVVVYNPDLVNAADLPASVTALTEARWRGKVGVAPTNGSFQAFVTALRVTRGEDEAKRFLAGLKSNDAQKRANNGAIVDDVASGKLAAGLVNHYYVYEKAAEDGTSVDQLKARLHFFRNGDPGGLVNVSGVGVTKRSKDDPDARRFVEYLLGNDAQTRFATKTFEYPLIAGVPAASGLPSLADLNPPKIDLSDLDSLDRTVAMIKESGLV